jgi:hypothetical protein
MSKKIRKRLTDAEAELLGFEVRDEPYSGKRNTRYQITREQLKTLRQYRNKGAKILIFDIETAPSIGYVWSKWQQNIHDEQLIQDWFLLTWSAKWLYSDEIITGVLTPSEAQKQDDKRIVKSLWTLFDEADILIGHNIKKFDVKKMNARYLIHGLNPPSSYQMIDTLSHARKQFSWHSNKLDYIAQKLGVGKKVETGGFDLWRRCMQGDKEALRLMSEYNNGDILINEQVYLKMRPFIKPHPNMNVIIDGDYNNCPSCGAEDSLKYNSTYHTYANAYSEYVCSECGNSCRANKQHTKRTPLPR